MTRKHKGFTLVELLIVIVVIGILSAMMMLSSTEAVTSAEASNIVSNLRNLKTAALSLYTDELDYADAGRLKDGVVTSNTTTAVTSTSFDKVVKYMNNSNVLDFVNYGIIGTNEGWFVYREGINDSRVQQKLAGRAKSVGIYGDTTAANLVNKTQYGKGNSAHTIAGMWVVKPANTATVK